MRHTGATVKMGGPTTMTDRLRSPTGRAGVMLKMTAAAGAALLLSSCAYWPGAGNNGILYTNVTKPIAVLVEESAVARTGEACSTGILGLFAHGNSSVNTAKARAGITKIAIVEERYTQYLLGAYSTYCTIVSGT